VLAVTVVAKAAIDSTWGTIAVRHFLQLGSANPSADVRTFPCSPDVKPIATPLDSFDHNTAVAIAVQGPVCQHRRAHRRTRAQLKPRSTSPGSPTGAVTGRGHFSVHVEPIQRQCLARNIHRTDGLVRFLTFATLKDIFRIHDD
jgi:hypothetical protein